jgi:hypothetical protein
MAIIAQELPEISEDQSVLENLSVAAALLSEASLLVRKIAAPATGKGAVLLASRQVEAADLLCHAPTWMPLLAARAYVAAITSFPGVASADAGFPR